MIQYPITLGINGIKAMEFGAGIEDVESPVRSDRVRVHWVQVRRSLPYPFP